MVFPADIARRRLTWILLTILGLLIAGALLLVTWIYNTARPPVFDAPLPVATNRFVRSIYRGAGTDLVLPNDVAVAANGEVYVADTGNARIVVFNSSGTYLREFGPGAGLVAPTSIAVGPDRVYVIDSAARKLLIYTRTGTLEKAVSFKEEAPIGVSYAPLRAKEGRVVVTTKSGVAIADASGTFSFAWINWGSKPTQMDNPAIALLTFSQETTSTLYVCDMLNYRIQALDSIETSPVVRWSYGTPLPATDALQYQGRGRKFGLPTGLALTSNNELVVVDGLSCELIMLNAQTGEYLRTISSVGNNDGRLYYPVGVAAAKGQIYVADKYNNRIEVFSDTVPVAPEPAPKPVRRLNLAWLYIVPLLVILGSLLRQLLLRSPRYTLDMSFIEQVADDEGGFALLSRLHRVRVPLQVEPYAEKRLPSDLRIDAVVSDEADMEELRDTEPDLDEFAAAAVLVAARSRRKDYFLVGDKAAAQSVRVTRAQIIHPKDFLTLASALKSSEQ
ncbi:MAG: NHL repeat-containing protein [Actinomycetia bacterium]|nr:NHL repeat-containing protein [Actinomycetes bacterium]